MNTPKRLAPGDHVCAQCGSAYRPNIHHALARCYGGDDRPANLITLCVSCHKRLHSQAGDFKEWGAWGGRETHARIQSRVKALKNLRQFKTWDIDKVRQYVITQALAVA